MPSTLRVPGSDRNPGSKVEALVEGVIQISGEHYLSAQALRGVGSPGVQKIAELRVKDPAQELYLHLLKLKILTLLDG